MTNRTKIILWSLALIILAAYCSVIRMWWIEGNENKRVAQPNFGGMQNE